MSKAAIFWDRDDTLIRDPGYLSDPDQVELLPGVARALKRLSEAGFLNVLATNQSGVARGLFTEERLAEIHERLQKLLDEKGARLDAIYYCPYLDGEEATVDAYRQDSDLRKPKPGMLVKASLENDIDLMASWSIGDSLRDAQAGRAAGCRTIVLAPDAVDAARLRTDRNVDFVAFTIDEAVDLVLRHSQSRPSEAAQAAATADGATTETLLQEILTFLRMVDRRNQSEDFSLARLGGAIVQILAIGALVWAVFGLIHGTGTPVAIRLLFGIQLQLLAATLFITSQRSANRHD